MHISRARVGAAVGLLVGVGLTSATFAIAAPRTAYQAAPHHPEIEAAIVALDTAKGRLAIADKDFGGHRVKAMGEIDNALKELNICLTYPNK
jgi:hypothetical protein